MPGTSASIKGLTKLAMEGTHLGKQAFSDLAEWVAKRQFAREAPELDKALESYVKDPAKIFLSERQTAHRVAPRAEIAAPEGFSFAGNLTKKVQRSPELRELYRTQEKFYNHNKDVVSKQARVPKAHQPREMAPTVRSVEELKLAAKSVGPNPERKALLGYQNRKKRPLTNKYEPSLMTAVQNERAAKVPFTDVVKKYPNVNKNTLSDWYYKNK